MGPDTHANPPQDSPHPEQAADIEAETQAVADRLAGVMAPLEWRRHAPYVAEILRLKRRTGAIILAHNYMTPEVFHGVADFAGDSLGLAIQAAETAAPIIVMAGVAFMAETARLLCPDRTVLLPDPRAGCSLADSITADDVRALRRRHPGLPVVVVSADDDAQTIAGALRYGAYQIGLGNDESITNNVYVRPDSPILKVKGFNKAFPEVYGSPETVKGKTILVTTVSSVHYAMSSWLSVLGLKDSDVVIKQMDEPRAGESTRGGVDPKTLRKAFDTTLALQLRKSQIKLSAEQSKSVQALIDAAASDEDLPHEIAVDTHRVADRFAETVSKVLAATVPPDDPERLEQIRKLTAELKTSVRLAFLKTRVPPPRLSTLVTTQDIREAGSGENVTRLKLKITEESVEWTMVESDGQMQGRLVPE